MDAALERLSVAAPAEKDHLPPLRPVSCAWAPEASRTRGAAARRAAFVRVRSMKSLVKRRGRS
ncbi:hypothetical protein D3C75_1284680 [compost metagenome]